MHSPVGVGEGGCGAGAGRCGGGVRSLGEQQQGVGETLVILMLLGGAHRLLQRDRRVPPMAKTEVQSCQVESRPLGQGTVLKGESKDA